MLLYPHRVSLTQLQSLPTTDLSKQSINVSLTLKLYLTIIVTLNGYRTLVEMYLYLYSLGFILIVECIITFLIVTLLLAKRKHKGSQERAIQGQHLQRPTSKTTVNVAYVPSFLWDVFYICELSN